MSVEIHRVTPADTALLDRIAEDVFDRRIDPALLAGYLAAPGHLMVVATADGVVIGQARGMVHNQPDEPTHLYVDNLGVTPARQREGVARRMMRELFAWAREHGCAAFWVATETDNGPARGLYASLGGEGEAMMFYEADL
ncbi:MAG: GNAT family N-acetyltransferase [Caulobacteraceae bacterium]|nr:GNAT family N-acetyltransferase [Caulobacteraceae bacterium]